MSAERGMEGEQHINFEIIIKCMSVLSIMNSGSQQSECLHASRLETCCNFVPRHSFSNIRTLHVVSHLFQLKQLAHLSLAGIGEGLFFRSPASGGNLAALKAGRRADNKTFKPLKKIGQNSNTLIINSRADLLSRGGLAGGLAWGNIDGLKLLPGIDGSSTLALICFIIFTTKVCRCP